jgi:hypothetical protein
MTFVRQNPLQADRGDPLMSCKSLSVSLFALVLGAATPTLAQTSQPHSATSTPSMGTNTAASAHAGATAQQFKTETDAKSACGGQPVVWANTSSHVLHASGTRYYGKTKKGAYMCQSSAEQAGYHMVKNDR